MPHRQGMDSAYSSVMMMHLKACESTERERFFEVSRIKDFFSGTQLEKNYRKALNYREISVACPITQRAQQHSSAESRSI